jgi:hypothetical protein
MKTQLKQTVVSSSIALIAFASAYITGCSKVNFSAAPQSCGSNCTYVNTNGGYDYSYEVKASKADILFVVDNSASMSPLQQQMASKFSNFINQIKSLDYQIGVTTTDMSANTAPYAGQASIPTGGQLVRFSDGSNILTKNSVNPQSQFTTAVTRLETQTCWNHIKPYCTTTSCRSPDYNQVCPSEDTRAIKAANAALSVNNSSGLFRDAEVPLNVVILSNADERVTGGQPGYPGLETDDQPSSLISHVQSQYPGKQLKVHSIIIRPGDTSCYNNQDQRMHSPSYDLFGWYGNVYRQASQATAGVSQSICGAFDLSAIGASVNTDDGSRDLACEPKAGTLTVTLTPSANIGHSVVMTSAGGYRLKFNSALPAGTMVHVAFTCQ